MYATVRRYKTDPSKTTEALRRSEQDLVPILTKQPGFIAYYAADSGDGVIISFALFGDKAQGDAAERLIEEWVASREADILPPPEVTIGQVVVHRETGQQSRKAA